MFANIIIWLLSCSLFWFHDISAQLEEGDLCTTHNGLLGVCKFIPDCPSAKGKFRGQRFTICGFVDIQSVICCPYKRPSVSEKINPSKGDISRKKCQDYKSNSIRFVQPYVAGGSIASTEEYAHVVRIGYIQENGITWSCAGSLISENFVLTAAHCLYHRKLGNATHIKTALKEEIREITVREKYPTYVHKYHDIGLLKVKGDIFLYSLVKPACLFVEDNYPYKYAKVAGWGKTEYGDYSSVLLEASLEIYPADQCNYHYRRNMGTSLRLGIIDDYMICAGSPLSIRDACEGDSGGPLQAKIDDIDHIIGITAFGKSCGFVVDNPGVYTRVSAYVDWIEKIVWPSAENVIYFPEF